MLEEADLLPRTRRSSKHRSVRRITSRRHLEDTMHDYTTHYNQQRPHRALALATPAGETPAAHGQPRVEIRRRDILGGVIHEY